MPAPIRYIESEQDLRNAMDACMEKTVVSVDTEFARFNTYYPMVGLIQIYDGAFHNSWGDEEEKNAWRGC